MEKEKKDWKYWFNEWEAYLSAILFIVNTVLLTAQVISRFVFRHSITWLEELATFLYLIMVYAGISAAVTHRKQICIDALPSALPFKAKKVFLVIADVVFIIFNIWIQRGLWGIVGLIGKGGTSLLHIPYALCYGAVAVSLILTSIRCVQDILRLLKETESELGYKKPSLDLEACEREYQEYLEGREQNGD